MIGAGDDVVFRTRWGQGKADRFVVPGGWPMVILRRVP